ncbi:hypothetical protein [Parageobacillus galactosidasius]|uniref:hypothetical protein n=1 Tax=Parageobacillus galactosidasius TaxID=883812 RepID=UPI00146E0C53|nr:hypothetical protein [Parageobacillus galactosidasius]
MNRLPHHQGIDKFLSMLDLALYFSKSVYCRIKNTEFSKENMQSLMGKKGLASS